MRVLGFKPPQNGKDIQLSLDLRIQKIVENNLVDRRGSVIVMEPYTGEIIAMASWPNFAPSVFVKRKNPDSIADYFSNPDAPLINRAISGVYPPASVFKLIVSSAALETGKINLATTFFCTGGIQIGNRRFACWDTHNAQQLPGGIAHSCDVFFYRTGLLLGPELIHSWALKFGLSKPTGIELPYESSGFLPHPLWRKIYKLRSWYDGDTANFAIGQGEVLVTPLQLTRLMAAFANRGILLYPHIVKAIDGQAVAYYPKKPLYAPIKASTLENIRKALREAVSLPTGTASVLSVLPVAVAGKTGSAQVSRGSAHGWFLGFFPYKEPRYVMCVFLENGGSGMASCIVARQIIQEMIAAGLVEG